MTIEITSSQDFKREYRQLVRQKPRVRNEFNDLIDSLYETGKISPSYRPHELINPRERHCGTWELHLSDPDDVHLIYLTTQNRYTFLHIGSHDSLFH